MIIIGKAVLTEFEVPLIQGSGDQLSGALGVYVSLIFFSVSSEYSNAKKIISSI